MNFLTKLDNLLTENNLNKHTFSKQSDIPYTTIDGWYKKGYDSMKLSTLKKLAKFFNTSLDFWADDNITSYMYGKVKSDPGIELYAQLDNNDKAEIRGEMKQMLKADNKISN